MSQESEISSNTPKFFKLQKRVLASYYKRECIICMESLADKNITLFNCGHLTCFTCAIALKNSEKFHCPLCRKELEAPKESESQGDQDDYCAMCEELIEIDIAYESDMDDNVSDALLKGSSYIINGKIKWLCELCDTENGQQNSCGHYFICGCDKEICEDCENKNSQSSDYVEDCDNEICKNYYLSRKDNCTCDSCGYCRFFA